MMLVILLSIGSFTIASNPSQRWYTDVWVNASTDQVIMGSNLTPQPPNSYHSYGPSARQTELDENRHPFGAIETFCILIFSTEYVLRLLSSPAGPGVVAYLFNWANVIDFISILPWYVELMFSGGSLDVLSVLRLIRLTRITRIFKMSKNFQGLILLFTTLRKSAAALLMLFAFMGIFSILFATLIYTFEMGSYDAERKQYVREDGSPSPFESIPSSLWWTIVTMTTVGYGDQYPVTDMGKVVAVLTMFCGLVVLSLPITIIGANFDLEYRELKKLKQQENERKRRERLAESQGRPGNALQNRAANTSETPDGGRRQDAATVATVRADVEDPIKVIQSLIHESNYKLLEEIDEVLANHEDKLRAQIKDVLRRHAAGIDLRPTPLDNLKVTDVK